MAIHVFPRLDVSGTQRWSPLRTAHWSTRGLRLCLPFGQAAVASRAMPPVLGATVGSGVGGTPQGINFQAATDSIICGSTTLLPLSRVTVLCVRQCADTTLRTGNLFSTSEGGTSNRCAAFVPLSDGTVYWDFPGTGTANGRLTAATTKTTQVEAWAFIAGSMGHAIWRNGVRLASSTTPASSRVFSGNFDVRINESGDIQQVMFFAVLDAEWLPTQIAEWSAHPWLMFGTDAWRAGLGATALELDTVVGSYAVTGSAADLLTGGSPGGQTYAWAYVG